MTSVDSNFNFLCGRPHGARPVHMRPPEPDSPPPPCGRHKWMTPIRFTGTRRFHLSKHLRINHGRRPREDWGTVPPKKISDGGNGPCIRPPNILRSSVFNSDARKSMNRVKKRSHQRNISEIGVFLVKKGH